MRSAPSAALECGVEEQSGDHIDLEQCFSTFSLQRNLRRCLRCSWNPMQWYKCLYCYNGIELWSQISSQAISVCFGGSPGNHSRNPGWKTLPWGALNTELPMTNMVWRFFLWNHKLVAQCMSRGRTWLSGFMNKDRHKRHDDQCQKSPMLTLFTC